MRQRARPQEDGDAHLESGLNRLLDLTRASHQLLAHTFAVVQRTLIATVQGQRRQTINTRLLTVPKAMEGRSRPLLSLKNLGGAILDVFVGCCWGGRKKLVVRRDYGRYV